VRLLVPLVAGVWLMNAAAASLGFAAPAQESLPVPPIPPDQRPSDDSAPLPDIGARGPREPEASSVRLAPSLYRHDKTFTPGEGYMPGSSFKENEQERLSKPTPGFSLHVTVP
jgi:hypothetical protein